MSSRWKAPFQAANRIEKTETPSARSCFLLDLLLILGNVQEWVIFRLWCSVTSTHSIASCKVLTIIDIEVKMVKCVMRRTVDNLFQWRIENHVTVMNQNRPKIDKDKQSNVDESV